MEPSITRRTRTDSSRHPDQTIQRRRPPLLRSMVIGVVLMGSIFFIGRRPQQLKGWIGGWSASVRSSSSGKQLLQELCTRYQAIQSYEDRTLMRLKYHVENRWHEEVVDALVRFVRPNSLRLHINLPTIQLLVTSDGQQLTSRILDQGNQQLDQQLVQHDVPPELSLQSLYAATEIVSTEGHQQSQSILMNLPCPLSVSQMSLLFDVQLVQQLIASSERMERLPDRALGGHVCARVELTSRAGKFVFWIDNQQGLLRRIEYPHSVPEESSPDQGPEASRFVMISVDYDNLRIDAAFPPGGFRQRPPAGADFVRHFVVPPARDAAGVLGRRVSNYWFTDLSGGQLRAAELTADVNVLVWFNNRAPSQAVMAHLNQVQQTYPESVNIIGVCTEPTTAMSHADVRQLRADWRLEFPVVRDLQAFGRDVFGVQQAPTLVAIDKHGVVQLFEVGGNSEMPAQLPIVFDKIKAGEPLAQQYLDYLDRQAEEYRELLAAATVTTTGNPPQPSQIGAARRRVAADRSRPATPDARGTAQQPPLGGTTLVREWSLQLSESELRQVRMVDIQPQPLIFVAAEEPVIYEVSVTGQRRESFPLIDIRGPRELRLFAPDRQAALFVTFSQRGPVNAFDHRWIARFSYPDAGPLRTEIRDAVVDDLDVDGLPEVYLALGDREVHCLTAQGKLSWSLDIFDDLRSLAVSHDQTGKRFLLVADDSDQITPLSVTGDRHESFRLKHPIRRLMASPRRAHDGAFCVVCGREGAGRRVVGLNAAFQEIWQRELPTRQPSAEPPRVDWVAWTAEGRFGFWLIQSSADELLIVSEDGSVAKSLKMRLPLTSVAGATYQERNYLLGTSASTLMAWQIELTDEN